MNKLRVITQNLVDNSTLSTSPTLAAGYTVNNLKSPARSTKIVTNAFGKGSTTFAPTEGGNNPTSLYISADDSKLYVLDTNIIYQYTLTTPGDLPSAVYDSKSFDVSTETVNSVGIFLSTDGTKLYISHAGAYIYYYDLSIAFDISTAVYNVTKDKNLGTSQSVSIQIWMKADGTELYAVDSTNSTVHRWTMSVIWHTSSATHTSSYSVVSEIAIIYGVSIHSDGSVMYAFDLFTSNLFQYDLITPWDITSASYANKLAVMNNQDSVPRVSFVSKLENKRVYLLGNNTDSVYQYEMAIDKSIDTLAYNSNNQTIFSQIGNPGTISSLVFGRHNFPKDTIINISLYSNIDFSGLLYNSGDLIVNTEQSGGELVKWGDFLWGEPGFTWGQDLVAGEFLSAFNFVHWITTPIDSVLSIKIIISNINSDEISFSRLIAGDYIQPTYNISYEHTLQWDEATKQKRASSGSTLRSTINFPYRKLEFSLNTINSADRTILQDGMRYVGLRKDFFVSLFPEDIDEEKKIDYSGIVKLTKIPSMSEHASEYYKSKYIMEEV